jgi:OmpA-OmpF porin, OOP family
MSKKLFPLIIVSLGYIAATSTIAFADSLDGGGSGGNIANNMYIGWQTGVSKTNYGGTEYLLPRNGVDDKKWGNRIYLGYAFSDLFGMELGYDYYGRVEFRDNLTGNSQSMLQHGMDLSGKVNIPLDHGFGVNARLGLAWVHRDAVESRSDFFVRKNSNSKLVPTGGVGLNYNFNQSWSADVSFSSTMKSGDLPYSYFYGLGLSYKFGKDRSY